MKRLSVSKKIRWAVIHQPTLLTSILNNPTLDPNITKGILRELIPRRTSIEIECIDNLAFGLGIRNLPTTFNTKWGSIKGYNYRSLAKSYGVHELVIEEEHSSSGYTAGTLQHVEDKIGYTEHNISIINYSQIIGLYKILNDMKKHCKLNTASGCHIHLDISHLLKPDIYAHYYELRKHFTKLIRQGTIEQIFGKYTGKMMHSKDCDSGKSSWININTKFHTLEFRTAPMTFEYSTIIRWFIAVNKLLSQFEYEHIKQNNTKQNATTVQGFNWEGFA